MHEGSYASLSSGLLARKGAAKPAMRPQSYGGFDDCGWNDMGQGHEAERFEPISHDHVPSSISALTPLPRGDENPVVAQQRAIADTFEEQAEEQAEEQVVAEAAPRAPAEVVKLPRRPAPVAAGKKSAFTLRLDADRHLRLRLACAVTGRSAQQLVASALDQLLESIPEIEALAAQVPAKGAKRR
jgi:hypothetical protein